ncbi:MAG: MBL fold metallo-hydrolase [Acidobacteriota bacterium]
MNLEVTILGSGTSVGVPVVGCDCSVCCSVEPRNRRLRSGLCVRAGERVILVDTSPDLREQCLRNDIRRVDAVLFTHAHADHIFGLDDLRPFNFRQRGEIRCYGSPATLEQIRTTFSYIFDGQPAQGGGKPRLVLVPVRGTFTVQDLEVRAVPVWHGSLEVYAYRFGSFAYVTDCSDIPQDAFEALRGVDTLVLDALRYEAHPTHFSIPEAVDMAARLGARQTYLTHLNHDVDYNAPAVDLPPEVELAYDGLSFSVS